MARTNARGFTLVELLLVTVIVAVLAAMLFPVLANARKQARMSRCTANLRQIGMAYQMYADNYQALPDPVRLVRSVSNHAVLACPEDSGETVAASSYTFRAMLPPDFKPYWERSELAPNTVLAVCNHHLERPTGRSGGTRTVGEARYPIKIALRAGGAVNRIKLGDIREKLIPGDRPAYMRIYPGEEGWDAAFKVSDEEQARN
jgi:prepilin-type N-terminal cleavage/methylation domain-containing protein